MTPLVVSHSCYLHSEREKTVSLISNGSDRTSELRKKGYAGRRLGPKQMTTDTAVRVTRMVVHEKGLQT